MFIKLNVLISYSQYQQNLPKATVHQLMNRKKAFSFFIRSLQKMVFWFRPIVRKDFQKITGFFKWVQHRGAFKQSHANDPASSFYTMPWFVECLLLFPLLYTNALPFLFPPKLPSENTLPSSLSSSYILQWKKPPPPHLSKYRKAIHWFWWMKFLLSLGNIIGFTILLTLSFFELVLVHNLNFDK